MKIVRNPIFLIGNQRSGTTWVANLLNFSKEVVQFFEPFEKGLTIFDDFPEEPTHIQEPSHDLIALFLKQYQEMLALEEKFINARFLSNITIAGLNFIFNLNTLWLLLSKINRIKKLQVMNQFRSENFHTNFSSKNEIVRPLIKETRLHLKLNFLLKAFKNAKICLLVRHPYPVIKSTIKWMGRGKLQELRKKLDYFSDVYETQALVNENYSEIVALGKKGSLQEKILAHWIISNDIAFSDYKNHPVSIKVVFYEAVCKNPVDGFRKLFQFFGLTFDDEIEANIVQSTTSHRIDDDMMRTQRVSLLKYRDWITEEIYSDKLFQKIQYYSKKFEVLEQVHSHYNTFLHPTIVPA